MILKNLNIFGSRASMTRLPFNTDIHCHVLPGVDHGAKDNAMACQLLEKQHDWGLERIIFTPHVTDDVYPNDKTSIETAFQKFISDSQTSIPDGMSLDVSAEYRLDSRFEKQLKDGNLIPLPGNHLLVELPFTICPGPDHINSMLFEIEGLGLKPILAHPERYIYFHTRDLSNYITLHNRGVEFQINLLSLAGYHGENERQTALRLIDKGLVDYCATDLHHFRHVDAIEKYLSSHSCQPTLKKLATLIKNDKL